MTSRVVRPWLICLMVFTAAISSAQQYPYKPVRIVTQAVGSGNDFLARVLAQKLTDGLGQQIIVDNRAVYTALALIVAKAPADGYTLLSTGSSIWTLPLLQTTPYDPVKDFSPIALVARSINVLVVHPSLALSSVKELIAVAKAKPGVLNYASGGTGAAGHLTGELFKSMAGVNIIHVPYKGGAAAISDLLAAQVQMTFDNPSTVMPLAKAGKLRALAVTSAEPSELVPGLPTVNASLPGFESVQLSGILAPAKTPEAIIRLLNESIVRALRAADVREKYFSRGIEVVSSSPEEFVSIRKADTDRWEKVIKGAGIRAD